VTVTLRTRSDITLDVYERVAWCGETVDIGRDALGSIDAARAAFLRLAARPGVFVYGVTSGYGDRAATTLDATERRQQSRAVSLRAASFGDPLPERVTRGIVLARLANFLDGHAAVSAELVGAVAAMLDGRALPPVPLQGNGGSGEILALAHLFAPLIESTELGEKEGLALINGSPCAAALVADAAVAARRRLDLVYDAFAVSVEAFRAPLSAYDEALDRLWGDAHDAAALARLRARLGADEDRRLYQAPVAYRILPRILGQAERAAAAATDAAAVALRSVTDNPVYLPPTDGEPDGRVLSTGGYHNAAAPAALHDLALCWVDVCQLAERHVERLVFDEHPLQTDGAELPRLLLMVAVGYSEEARAATQPVVLPRGGPGQNDVASPAFLAYARERAAGAALEAGLAVLAAAASRRADGLRLLPGPRSVVANAADADDALRGCGPVGHELARLADRLRSRIWDAR
jgi:histidine ammonia-lyase